jgi:mRNA-degrading endonuclease toxin of MazEF toxin-antitoxin module
MADQISTISKVRLKDKIGALSPADMQEIESAIRVQLGFSR